MISTTSLAKEYGARVLFDDVSLQLNAGSRYGVVGANGSGKSTFLRILAGDEPASGGSFTIARRARVGVLRQDRFLEDDAIILDLAMRGDDVVWRALQDQHALVGSLDGQNAADGTATAERLAALEDIIAAHDGYTLEARASAVLEGLGIPGSAHRQPLATLSGGFKLRVLLAQVLVGGADVLLLDEPTNHLDILTIRWLEKFLAAYAGCAVIISHDQRFLDNVTTHTLDVDYGTITLYPGNHAAFAVQKAEIRARKETEIARAEEEVARKRAFVERFGAKATKATQAQSRLKQIEKIEIEELPPSSRRTPALRFVPVRPSGREVVSIEHVSKAYGPKRVLSDVSLAVRRGERIAIIGANGLGKSTLLKLAVGTLPGDGGEIRWGHETHVGYFPQDHREVLTDPNATPLAIIDAAYPGESPTTVRGALGRVLFSGDDIYKPVRLLSGGEAARLVFAVLAARKPNVLVLDEPTNHLDVEAIEALVEALKAYEGTLLFVSHDRWFVSELATRIAELTAAGLRDFPGSYPEYLAKCGDDHLDAEAVVAKAKRARAEAAQAGDSAAAMEAASWEEQKRRRNRAAQLPKRRDQLLAEIAAAEARQREIEALYCSDGFFTRTDAAEVARLENEKAALGPRIDALLEQWETVERELAELADAPASA